MQVSINDEALARDVIVIGASAGGIRAVMEILARFPADLPAVVGVVIHRGASSTADWSEVLGMKSRIRVVEPEHGDRLARSVVYVAPPDCHMVVDGERVLLDHGPKRQFTRPAVDPLFTSAALSYGARVVGVILTGGGQDGVQGLIDIHASGGLTLVQSPAEAKHASMPMHAITADHVDAVLSLAAIGEALVQLARGERVMID
jgi:two-component system, chemotaxis family, protein-glutamate methylesterase/glutaminase